MTSDGELRTVVFVSAVTGHGGPNASLRQILQHQSHLATAGMRAILAGPYDDAERRHWERAGIEVHPVPRPRGASARARAAVLLWRLFHRLRRDRPLAFANGLTEAAVLAPVLALQRVDARVWIHNSTLPGVARALSPVLRRLPRQRLRLAAVSTVAADVGRRVLGEDAEIGWLPNPVPVNELGRLPPRPVLAGRSLRVAYLGGTDRPVKGFDLLAPIIAAADGGGLEWRVVADEATQPDAWHRLRALPAELAKSRLQLYPRTHCVEQHYAWADVVLIPSRRESFSRVAAEAMAAGAAVVASDLPAVREVCGTVASFFPPGHTAEAAQRLCALAADPEALAEAGRQGRRRAARFATEHVVREFGQFVAGGPGTTLPLLG